MTMSRRTAIQTALITTIDTIPEILTVLAVNNIDDKYPRDLTVEQLPAVKVYFTDETPKYHPGNRALNKLSPDLYLYTIEWTKTDTSNEENLLKLLRNKLGEDPRLNNSCVDISLRDIIKLEVLYPLVCYKINANIVYEESNTNL